MRNTKKTAFARAEKEDGGCTQMNFGRFEYPTRSLSAFENVFGTVLQVLLDEMKIPRARIEKTHC